MFYRLYNWLFPIIENVQVSDDIENAISEELKQEIHTIRKKIEKSLDTIVEEKINVSLDHIVEGIIDEGLVELEEIVDEEIVEIVDDEIDEIEKLFEPLSKRRNKKFKYIIKNN